MFNVRGGGGNFGARMRVVFCILAPNVGIYWTGKVMTRLLINLNYTPLLAPIFPVHDLL